MKRNIFTIRQKHEIIYQLKKRESIIDLLNKRISLNNSEISFLRKDNKNYEPKILTRKVFEKYFPNSKNAINIDSELKNKSKNLYEGNSKYYRKKDGLYCGTFDIELADKILILFHDKNYIKKIKQGIFYNIISEITFNSYSVVLLKDIDYLQGLPLYIGETTNTCESLGKLGSDLAINHLITPELQICLIKKKLSNNKEIHLGHALLWISKDKDKIVLSALETKNIPIHINIELLKKLSIALCENMKNKLDTNFNIQIGLGGRTLRSLGYYKDNFPIELLSRHLEIVRCISKEKDYDILMKYIYANKNPLLEGFIFTLDNEKLKYSLGEYEIHEDSNKYRIKLIDSTNIEHIKNFI